MASKRIPVTVTVEQAKAIDWLETFLIVQAARKPRK